MGQSGLHHLQVLPDRAHRVLGHVHDQPIRLSLNEPKKWQTLSGRPRQYTCTHTNTDTKGQTTKAKSTAIHSRSQSDAFPARALSRSSDRSGSNRCILRTGAYFRLEDSLPAASCRMIFARPSTLVKGPAASHRASCPAST